MSSNGRIADEAAYQKSLDWMVSKAVILDDPLQSPEDKSKLQRTYDFVEQRIHEYKRGKMVLMYPGLRKIYQDAGKAFQEFPPEKEGE